MNEMIDSLQSMGDLLGFASLWIGWAYIGALVASLLCISYGLILWNKGRRIRRVQGAKRGRRVRVQRLKRVSQARVLSSRRGRVVKKGRRPWRRLYIK